VPTPVDVVGLALGTCGVHAANTCCCALSFALHLGVSVAESGACSRRVGCVASRQRAC
jgi:UDP-N-acetylmuramyl pentapeptide synthase